MIERIAAITADRLAECWPCVEHQEAVAMRMRGKHRKHRALRIGCQMEKAVPRQNAVECPAELQAAHVGDDPFLVRHALTA